jgi:hypothetical protein
MRDAPALFFIGVAFVLFIGWLIPWLEIRQRAEAHAARTAQQLLLFTRNDDYCRRECELIAGIREEGGRYSSHPPNKSRSRPGRRGDAYYQPDPHDPDHADAYAIWLTGAQLWVVLQDGQELTRVHYSRAWAAREIHADLVRFHGWPDALTVQLADEVDA